MRRQYILAEFLDHSNAFVRQVLPMRTAAVLRWNATSTASMTLRDDHPIIPTLVNEVGIRCAVWLVTIVDGTSLSKRRLLEGRVGKVSAKDAPYGTVIVPVASDFQDLSTLLGWQVPAAAINGQGAAEYARYTGPAETNAKDVIAANVARLGKPWDVMPSLGRGPSAPPLEIRMDELAEKILPPLVSEGLQLTIERTPGQNRWVVDVRAGTLFPRPLTPQSGVVASWEWVVQPATATRAVVGGRGEGVERQFAVVVDEALEAAMGVVLEIFVDARNADEGADLAPYGRAKLAEHAARSGVKVALRETTWFRFPESYDLGDKLPVRIGPMQLEDAITQIDITHDVDKGMTIVPTIGTALDDPQARFVGFVKNVATAVRGLQRR